jgi:transcription elongation factor Elf1
MPSTFECPFCKSRYNNWIASTWEPETETEVSTYQCKQCLTLFEHKISFPEEESDGKELAILEM